MQQAMRAVSVAEQARIVSSRTAIWRARPPASPARAAAGAATSFDLVDAEPPGARRRARPDGERFNLIQAKVTTMLTTANCTCRFARYAALSPRSHAAPPPSRWCRPPPASSPRHQEQHLAPTGLSNPYGHQEQHRDR
ncbi:MAG: hypothetical protein U0359_19430 [Byssovorax sp.]